MRTSSGSEHGDNPRSWSLAAAHGLAWLSLVWVLVLFRRLGTIGLVPGVHSPGMSLFESIGRFDFFAFCILALHGLALWATIPLPSPTFSPGPKRVMTAAAGMLAAALISAFSIGTYLLPSVALLAASSVLCALGSAARAAGTILSAAALWGFFAATGLAVLPAAPSVSVATNELRGAAVASGAGRDRTATATLAPPPRPAPDAGTADRWKKAAEAIRRLRPSETGALPETLVKELEKAGCKVPQMGEPFPEATQPHNFVKGTFSALGGTDWAVLCSRGGKSAIRVVWGAPEGAGNCTSELAPFDDTVFLQGMGDGLIAFSRIISAVDKDYITSHYEAYGGNAPPAEITHQGINDAFAGKASTVHFCHDGKWLELSGAD